MMIEEATEPNEENTKADSGLSQLLSLELLTEFTKLLQCGQYAGARKLMDTLKVKHQLNDPPQEHRENTLLAAAAAITPSTRSKSTASAASIHLSPSFEKHRSGEEPPTTSGLANALAQLAHLEAVYHAGGFISPTSTSPAIRQPAQLHTQSKATSKRFIGSSASTAREAAGTSCGDVGGWRSLREGYRRLSSELAPCANATSMQLDEGLLADEAWKVLMAEFRALTIARPFLIDFYTTMLGGSSVRSDGCPQTAPTSAQQSTLLAGESGPSLRGPFIAQVPTLSAALVKVRMVVEEGRNSTEQAEQGYMEVGEIFLGVCSSSTVGAQTAMLPAEAEAKQRELCSSIRSLYECEIRANEKLCSMLGSIPQLEMLDSLIALRQVQDILSEWYQLRQPQHSATASADHSSGRSLPTPEHPLPSGSQRQLRSPPLLRRSSGLVKSQQQSGTTSTGSSSSSPLAFLSSLLGGGSRKSTTGSKRTQHRNSSQLSPTSPSSTAHLTSPSSISSAAGMASDRLLAFLHLFYHSQLAKFTLYHYDSLSAHAPGGELRPALAQNFSLQPQEQLELLLAPGTTLSDFPSYLHSFHAFHKRQQPKLLCLLVNRMVADGEEEYPEENGESGEVAVELATTHTACRVSSSSFQGFGYTRKLLAGLENVGHSLKNTRQRDGGEGDEGKRGNRSGEDQQHPLPSNNARNIEDEDKAASEASSGCTGSVGGSVGGGLLDNYPPLLVIPSAAMGAGRRLFDSLYPSITSLVQDACTRNAAYSGGHHACVNHSAHSPASGGGSSFGTASPPQQGQQQQLLTIGSGGSGSSFTATITGGGSRATQQAKGVVGALGPISYLYDRNKEQSYFAVWVEASIHLAVVFDRRVMERDPAVVGFLNEVVLGLRGVKVVQALRAMAATAGS